jgi:hypothetical protein
MASTLDSTTAPRAGRSVAGHATYDEARRAVDRLSDSGFPVENADIIGSDLLLLGGLVIGAAWGAVLGFFAHWATGGRRDFSSERGLVAGRYEVVVTDAEAERAHADRPGPVATSP